MALTDEAKKKIDNSLTTCLTVILMQKEKSYREILQFVFICDFNIQMTFNTFFQDMTISTAIFNEYIKYILYT